MAGISLAPPRPKAGRLSRLVRPGLAAAGLLALGGLMLALFVVAGGPNPSETVSPPPSDFHVLERPQTAQEAAIRIPAALSVLTLQPRSIRIADADRDARYLIGRDASGEPCLRREVTRGGVAETCASDPPQVMVSSLNSTERPRTVFGLVPDGVRAVSVNGQRVTPRDNVFHATLEQDARSLSVDFLTVRGTVGEWHEERPLYPPTDAMFSEPPRLGVACSIANDPSCERVGLAVWLREPARAVRAVIDGRSFALDDPQWSGPIHDGLRRMFAGFLHPAGFTDGSLRIPANRSRTWEGYPEVSAPVAIRVTSADGSTRVVTVEVNLAPGWG